MRSVRGVQRKSKLTSTYAQIRDQDSNSVYSDHCNVLISATGALNDWKWPDIPGLGDFQGKLMHSARWDEEYDYTVSYTFCASSLIYSPWARVHASR